MNGHQMNGHAQELDVRTPLMQEMHRGAYEHPRTIMNGHQMNGHAQELDVRTPLMQEMHRGAYEDTPAYEVLKTAGVLETKYRRANIDDIFTGKDVKANTTKSHNLWKRLKS